MLNRRFLRTKVFQALYALEQGAGGGAAKNEKKKIIFSIKKVSNDS